MQICEESLTGRCGVANPPYCGRHERPKIDFLFRFAAIARNNIAGPETNPGV
ncbi:hypothetical protein Z950_717 [Sulfitobacter mediterraneus KCTC 32188]|nr:hypothetical protein Z950_717 [Sulfitobacter mediterraneus KCTC 32188]